MKEKAMSRCRCFTLLLATALSASGAFAETYILPSSSYRVGANGAEYQTDVRIFNHGSVPATVTAYFFDQVTGTTWQSSTFRIEARNQAAFDNILHSLFGRTLLQGAYGPIWFEASGRLLVGASVNNVNACGSGAISGQWLPGILTSAALRAGVIGQIAISADTSSGYRTNLVFVNPGGPPATLNMRMRRGGGDIISAVTIGPLSPNGFRQLPVDTNAFPGLAGLTDTNLWLEFSSDQPVIAFATVIHNVSGDPFAVMAASDSGESGFPTAPVISSFTASPATISPGGFATLTWTSTGGTSAAIDNGVGSVPLNGSRSVAPSQTTTYTLTVAGDGGATSSTSRVTVSALANEVTVMLPGGIPLILVRIPAGTFQMGSPETERGRVASEVAHAVTLTQDYYIGKYEVTQAQWLAVMGTNPSNSNGCGGGCPVENVSWEQIRGTNGFLARLNQLQGTTKFRLPTEAEWERAARGGTQTRFWFGDALTGDDDCGVNGQAEAYAWWCGNASSGTHPVGLKGASQYGLHDVHGNVAELVEDWFGDYSAASQTDPKGPASGTLRVQRGGDYINGLRYARSAFRVPNSPSSTGWNVGFRLAMSP